MNFLKNILSSCLGMMLAFTVIILFGFGLAVALSGEEEIVVKPNTILEINLEEVVNDYTLQPETPFDELFIEPKFQLTNILNAIENAKYDDNIKGISINMAYVNAGLAQLKEIRDKIGEFKETGKFVKAYADFYSQSNYYLSSVADSVYITPYGAVDFKGLATERLYYKDFQEKYGVKMEVIRHGKYKSAVEGYMDNNMSEANREQTTALLSSVWNTFLTDISESRNIRIDSLNNIADRLDSRTSEKSVEIGLVDGAIYYDQYLAKINPDSSSSEVNMIELSQYIKAGKGKINVVSSDRIAVLYAQGTILYGEGDETYIGQDNMNKALQKLRKDDNVKAVVLRINSPGGAAITADLIWRELELLKQKKPLVVSMGDVAASGGYWIAANANKIFAEPTTITGSIGVFGVIPNVSELSEDIGINAEQVATNERSLTYSVFEPMTADFYSIQKEAIERVYKTFLERVSDGRGMTVEEVNLVAQGRVWTGEEAKEIGLVDSIGGLQDAIEAAAGLAGVMEYRIVEYPRYQKDFKDTFAKLPIGVIKSYLIKSELGEENYKLFHEIVKLNKFRGVQALMPHEFKVK